MSPSMDEASLEEFVMAPFPVGTVTTAEKRERWLFNRVTSLEQLSVAEFSGEQARLKVYKKTAKKCFSDLA